MNTNNNTGPIIIACYIYQHKAPLLYDIIN